MSDSNNGLQCLVFAIESFLIVDLKEKNKQIKYMMGWNNETSFQGYVTMTMTSHFKCNFNSKTTIPHNSSSFCHQSLKGLERDKVHICDSLVIVRKYNLQLRVYARSRNQSFVTNTFVWYLPNFQCQGQMLRY